MNNIWVIRGKETELYLNKLEIQGRFYFDHQFEKALAFTTKRAAFSIRNYMEERGVNIGTPGKKPEPLKVYKFSTLDVILKIDKERKALRLPAKRRSAVEKKAIAKALVEREQERKERVDCGKAMHEFIAWAEKDQYDYFTVRVHSKKEWNKNYAYAIVEIHEEEYRDYDQLKADIVSKLQELVPWSTVTNTSSKGYADTRYEIQLSHKSSGLSIEVFLWNTKWMKERP